MRLPAIMTFRRPILSDSAPNTVKNGMPISTAIATTIDDFTRSTFMICCMKASA